MLTLIDAPRCPYCARVRIALAEKGVEHETVVIDLDDRPAWLYEMNPVGQVPVIDEDGWVLPESAVINEYLEEQLPEPPLLPAGSGGAGGGTAADLSLRRLHPPLLRAAAGAGGSRGRRSPRRSPHSTRLSPECRT